MARTITQETRRARIHHSLHLRGRSATNSASSICHRRTSTSCHRGLVSHRGGSRVAFAGFRSRPTATLARAGASLRLSFTFCAALLFLRGSFRAIPDGTSTSSRLPTTREHDRDAFSLGGPHRGIDRRRVDIGHVVSGRGDDRAFLGARGVDAVGLVLQNELFRAPVPCGNTCSVGR